MPIPDHVQNKNHWRQESMFHTGNNLSHKPIFLTDDLLYALRLLPSYDISQAANKLQ